VVLTGAGDRAFSAGSDIREFPRDAEAGRQRSIAEHACYDAIERLPQPVIAALHGHVLGGGLELALACDLRIADASTRLGLPEVKLGVFPSGGGTQRLPRLVGAARAKELMFLGEPIDAAEAQRVGLVNRVVDPGRSLETALNLAHDLSQRPALAIQAIKQAVDIGLREGPVAGQAAEDELIASLFTSHDVAEGVSALLAKRAPQFEHR
jgi:enoyl-CoA hydratase/carnithine racemase